MSRPSCEQLRHPKTGETYALLRERARAMRQETGASLGAIAATLDVTKVVVSKWVRDLPDHAKVCRLNVVAHHKRRRLYPRGTASLVTALRLQGVPQAERIRLAREATR
ncbi:MAG: hypothetical protein INR70_11330 [Parafilimonas terrae]|nr:hypothetical protein [Parafilimonas terrae]